MNAPTSLMRPDWFVDRLKDDPLGAAVQAFIEDQRESANRNVFPV